MALNPSKRAERLDNPIDRSNPVNEPDYAHEEGYNPFTLTQPSVFTTRYGEVTPISVCEGIPADRHLVNEGIKSFMDQIQDRVLNDAQMYVDYFHVPYRQIFPYNYDKIIVNPVKGSDVPLAALPAMPLLGLFRTFLEPSHGVIDIKYSITIPDLEGNVLPFTSTIDVDDQSNVLAFSNIVAGVDNYAHEYFGSHLALVRLLYFAFVFSRGQLLDNLNFGLDDISEGRIDHNYKQYKNVFQQHIDNVFNSLLSIDYFFSVPNIGDVPISSLSLNICGLDISSDLFTNTLDLRIPQGIPAPDGAVKVLYRSDIFSDTESISFNLSGFRAALYECFEKGLYPLVYATGFIEITDGEKEYVEFPIPLTTALYNEYNYFNDYLSSIPTEIDLSATDFDTFFDQGFINPSRIVAYQQSVAHYMSEDSVDNVFTSELWMQNIRALMFPSRDGITQEPTFKYNGVDYEYDLFTTGAIYRAFMSEYGQSYGFYQRILPFISNVFIQRRSLRFKDYFSGARVNMLAVGDLTIPVESSTSVSPIDVTRGLVLQRFFNAVNRWGMKAVNYMASLFGVVPSGTEQHPAWICRRVNSFNGDTTANTNGSDTQGRISTNLVATTGQKAFDVFLDDFGVLLGVVTYSIQPYYPSGIERPYRHYDRFTLFNPMLQDVGDQEIRADELTGDINHMPSVPFGYCTRYGEYKQRAARAHGGFVNDIPSRVFVYPFASLFDPSDVRNIHIDPDFIRDAPFYLDNFKESLTGLSPAQYYHFQLSVQNNHKAARKIKVWPGIL